MQVLINGRSVYSPLYGGVQWSELPLAIADIERIEIPAALTPLVMAANSFFGVINIITQSPQTMSTSSGSSLIATHGNGRNEAFYRQAGKWDQLSFRVTTGYREDDGLRERNDFKRTCLLNAQADYQLNDQNSLEFEFGLADGVRGEGDINEEAILFLPRTKQINNHFELIRWRHSVSEDSDFTLQGYHSFDRSDDQATSIDISTLFPGVVAPGTFINSKIEIETERYDIEAQHNFSLGPSIRAVWGGGVRQDSMVAPHYGAPVDLMRRADVRIARKFNSGKWHGEVAVVVENLFNHQYEEFADYNTLGRRARLNMSLNY